MKTTSIIRNTKLPDFIREHKIFKKVKEINKIFPMLGLTNCSMPANKIDYKDKAAIAFKNSLIALCNNRNIYTYSRVGLTRLGRRLAKYKGSDFLTDGKLALPAELKDFNQQYSTCLFGWRRPRTITYKLNLVGKNSRVVFSSSGTQGAWDIATMSMRGIRSCQSWSGIFKRNLVGSIVDPFVGIIYLENPHISGKYGSRMHRRALVRYVIDKQSNKPALMLERIYPRSNSQIAPVEPEVIGLFIQFLKEKTGNKLPIVTSNSARHYHIPNSKVVSKMSACGVFQDAKYHCKSYRDSGIQYADSYAIRIKNIKPF